MGVFYPAGSPKDNYKTLQYTKPTKPLKPTKPKVPTMPEVIIYNGRRLIRIDPESQIPKSK